METGRTADFTRDCEDCPHIRSEIWDNKGRIAFRCFAPGTNRGYVVRLDWLGPPIPAWCPKLTEGGE